MHFNTIFGKEFKMLSEPISKFFFMKIMKKYLTEVLICHYHYHTRKLFD